MTFEVIKCTNDFLNEMGLPAWMKQSRGTTPIGRTIAYSRHEKAIFFPHAMDHATYPDQGYSLCITGRCLNVWQLQPSSDQPKGKIEIYVSEELSEFSDETLSNWVKRAFNAYSNSSECPEIYVLGRTRSSQPQEPRTPQQIMKLANQMADMASDQVQGFAAQVFANTFKEDEFFAWFEHGNSTNWCDLTDDARSLVHTALELRNQAE